MACTGFVHGSESLPASKRRPTASPTQSQVTCVVTGRSEANCHQSAVRTNFSAIRPRGAANKSTGDLRVFMLLGGKGFSWKARAGPSSSSATESGVHRRGAHKSAILRGRRERMLSPFQRMPSSGIAAHNSSCGLHKIGSGLSRDHDGARTENVRRRERNRKSPLPRSCSSSACLASQGFSREGDAHWRIQTIEAQTTGSGITGHQKRKRADITCGGGDLIIFSLGPYAQTSGSPPSGASSVHSLSTFRDNHAFRPRSLSDQESQPGQSVSIHAFRPGVVI
jgi:hypothetical protein